VGKSYSVRKKTKQRTYLWFAQENKSSTEQCVLTIHNLIYLFLHPCVHLLSSNTRLAKLDAADSPYTCLLLAAAGLLRLNFDERITATLPPSVMLHAVGQGSIAIECRSDDTEILELIKPLDHLPTRLRCEAERSVMRILEGGCSVPIGVWTEFVHSSGSEPTEAESVGKLRMKALVASLDGNEIAEAEAVADVNGNIQLAVELGQNVANQLLAKGADRILAKVLKDRSTTLIPTGTGEEQKIKGWEV
jgi:hydroxymethylbilane synthase